MVFGFPGLRVAFLMGVLVFGDSVLVFGGIVIWCL